MAVRSSSFGFVLAACLTLPASAFADELFDGVSAIPGAVEDVRIGGTWAKGSDAGQYRLVVTRSGGNDIAARLFVQWVAYGDAGDSKVTNTIEIKEFGELGVDITSLNTESDDSGLSVFIGTRDPSDPVERTYELFVFSPTEYRFGAASN